MPAAKANARAFKSCRGSLITSSFSLPLAFRLPFALCPSSPLHHKRPDPPADCPDRDLRAVRLDHNRAIAIGPEHFRTEAFVARDHVGRRVAEHVAAARTDECGRGLERAEKGLAARRPA